MAETKSEKIKSESIETDSIKTEEVYQNTGRKLSLNRRLVMISVSIVVPMTMLVVYLMYLLNSTNHAFDGITESITYANNYAEEFKERMDYSVYLAVIRGEPTDQLEEGKVTVNGVKIVNPYSYIKELQMAFEHMSKIATVSSNKNLSLRMQKTLNSLNKMVMQIDANMDDDINYDENLALLRGDINSLTQIIEGGIQEYICAENGNFSSVRTDMIQRAHQAVHLSFLVVLAVSLLAVLMSLMASRSVTQPIQQLCGMAKQLAKGDFSARTDVEAEDEIAVLTKSFNDMAGEIGNLVEGIKTEQANLRITESKLLQAQINPHFLYNTLDTIVWLAEEKQTEDVVSMVTWLSDFFRTTLSKGNDCITVEEERFHIESYLKIQQFRYQDILEYEINIEEEIYPCIIPKLTLQPLVENALYHGIKMKRGKGKIIILGFRKGDRLIFKVVDNGRGMSEAVLNDLRRRIAGLETSRDGGFGLANVNQRLQHYYGEEYGVFMDSTENIGTEAAVIVSAKKNITLS